MKQVGSSYLKQADELAESKQSIVFMAVKLMIEIYKQAIADYNSYDDVTFKMTDDL